mmetsp:Transcript_126689/g.364386  ORF Transcript_126689/g.364386 Transcript_126689/m.364386 type:complete len:286 (+) Transcript_126689:562-1419(+)
MPEEIPNRMAIAGRGLPRNSNIIPLPPAGGGRSAKVPQLALEERVGAEPLELFAAVPDGDADPVEPGSMHRRRMGSCAHSRRHKLPGPVHIPLRGAAHTMPQHPQPRLRGVRGDPPVVELRGGIDPQPVHRLPEIQETQRRHHIDHKLRSLQPLDFQLGEFLGRPGPADGTPQQFNRSLKPPDMLELRAIRCSARRRWQDLGLKPVLLQPDFAGPRVPRELADNEVGNRLGRPAPVVGVDVGPDVAPVARSRLDAERDEVVHDKGGAGVTLWQTAGCEARERGDV